MVSQEHRRVVEAIPINHSGLIRSILHLMSDTISSTQNKQTNYAMTRSKQSSIHTSHLHNTMTHGKEARIHSSIASPEYFYHPNTNNK